jgi:hypothetical protein
MRSQPLGYLFLQRKRRGVFRFGRGFVKWLQITLRRAHSAQIPTRFRKIV